VNALFCLSKEKVSGKQNKTKQKKEDEDAGSL
jgi:hypothetical protein